MVGIGLDQLQPDDEPTAWPVHDYHIATRMTHQPIDNGQAKTGACAACACGIPS